MTRNAQQICRARRTDEEMPRPKPGQRQLPYFAIQILRRPLVGRGREGVQLGHRSVVQHAEGDLPAGIGEVGQSRFIAQAVFGLNRWMTP